MNTQPNPTQPLPSTRAGRPARRDVQVPLTLEEASVAFLEALAGKNRAASTIKSYGSDLVQFIRYLHETNVVITAPDQVEKLDITEYLTFLSQQGTSGVTRARKLASVREYFRFLVAHGYLASSPAAGVETPKKEQRGRSYLRPEEYNKLLAQAGSNPRDYAILQVFLQAGLRVSELADLQIQDIDLAGRMLTIRGKGMVTRTVELEKKGIAALKNWLAMRPSVSYDQVFLNRYGKPFSDRGVEKLISSYCKKAGMTKKVTCHLLRHTFATQKVRSGVSLRQVQEWLGHANLNTTQIYVHTVREDAGRMMERSSL